MSEPLYSQKIAFFEGSRSKAAYGVVGCLVAVLVGWLLAHGDGTLRTPASFQHGIGWLTITVFGLFGLAWTASLFAPPRLWIEEDGFSFKTPWREKKYRSWQDIDQIWVRYQQSTSLGVPHQQSTSFVVWTLKGRNGGLSLGYDESLRGGWAASAEELAYELNVAKERHSVANLTV